MRHWMLLLAFSAGCYPPDGPNAPLPGAPKQLDTMLLETGAQLMQRDSPANTLVMYVHGFHAESGDPYVHETAHHYCHPVSEELIQCAIYDGNTHDARLVGIEYIVSARAFEGFPVSEQALWHAHNHEVLSGLLIAPGIPGPVEHQLMEKLVGTYGKTWHLWHTAHNSFPVGPPRLMKSIYDDDQMDPQLLRERDHLFGVNVSGLRAGRADIADPGFNPVVLRQPVCTCR